MNAAAGRISKNEGLTVYIISSILITSFLFFIDEGYYNFKWATDIFSWIIFLVYATPIFGGQMFLSNVILKKLHGPGKIVLSVATGSIVGILLVVGLIF